MKTINTNVVVYTFMASDINGTRYALKLARTVQNPFETDKEILAAYGPWISRDYILNQSVDIVEGGPHDGAYDLSRFEK